MAASIKQRLCARCDTYNFLLAAAEMMRVYAKKIRARTQNALLMIKMKRVAALHQQPATAAPLSPQTTSKAVRFLFAWKCVKGLNLHSINLLGPHLVKSSTFIDSAN
jgi:hypothetical protein